MGQHILIIVQNLPVPLDRRVWLECQALRDAGYRVSVICPKGPGDPPFQELDGVRIYKYQPAPPTEGVAGYLWEFAYSWVRTALIARRVWSRDRFGAVQACNPPDTYWALARRYVRAGAAFVYDQHDLNPEVFRSRFGEPRGISAKAQYRGLLWLERRTYRSAHHVIATNESYKRTAMQRGGLSDADVTVVRSGPDTRRMRPVDGDPALRNGRSYLAVWLGIMGPQDGVDVVLRALDLLVHGPHGYDIQLALLGFGDCLGELKELAHELKLDDHVTFTGRADPDMIARYLSSADIALSPDPKSPLNDVSTMNKTMEYMCYALPIVAFDLTETRVSGCDAAVYVAAGGDLAADTERYAAAVGELLGDPERRADLSVRARRRVETELDWEAQRQRYVGVYDRLFGIPPRNCPAERSSVAPADGQRYVDVADTAALRRFARSRRAN